MENKAQDDDLVMNLVELALGQPEQERRAYLQRACAGETELFEQAWEYVQWESRMKGFLMEPLYSPPVNEHPFEQGELLDGRFRILREIAQGGMGVKRQTNRKDIGKIENRRLCYARGLRCCDCPVVPATCRVLSSL
jgi:hypothetical protein